MPRKKIVPMRPTTSKVKQLWGSNLKDELAKLKALMQQTFSEVVTDPSWDPNVKLVHAFEYGGDKNQFILCREVDGVLTLLDPEINEDPVQDPVDIKMEPTIDNTATTSQSKLAEILQQQTSASFYKQGMDNIQAAQFKPILQKPKPLPKLFTVVTSRGKRIDLDNDALIFLQKKADGHGIAGIPFHGEMVKLDINAIMNSVRSGGRVMEMNNIQPLAKPSAPKVDLEAQKAIQDQLEKTLAQNARRIKKTKVTH